MKVTLQNIRIFNLLLLTLAIGSITAYGQEEGEEENKQIRPPFESALLIDNQTTVVYSPRTLEFNILHRFGTWNNGYDDLWGIWAPSNIRLALNYSPLKGLLVGAGLTKNERLLDLNAKYTFLNQTRSGNIPVSIAYYGNMAISTKDKEFFDIGADRVSYFSQLLISRKINYWVSLQVAPSMTHFNFVNSETRKNDHFAISGMARVKVASQLSIILNLDQAITSHKLDNPNPNLALGVEMATSGHSFQIFGGNYAALSPQYNNMYNSNDLSSGEFLIGFNITRLWNL